MHTAVFRQAQPFPIPNSSPWKYSVPSVVSLLCSAAAQKECPAHGLCCPHRCSTLELERAQRAARCCRALQEQGAASGVSHPHSNDLALLVTGNHSSADMDECSGIHQPLDRGAGRPGGSTTCKREGTVLIHQAGDEEHRSKVVKNTCIEYKLSFRVST